MPVSDRAVDTHSVDRSISNLKMLLRECVGQRSTISEPSETSDAVKMKHAVNLVIRQDSH